MVSTVVVVQEAGRRLMEAAPSGDLSVVKTAEELIAAVERGGQHIELHDHIDFTSSTPRTPYYHDGKLSGFDRMLGTLSKTTQSIRVRPPSDLFRSTSQSYLRNSISRLRTLGT